MRADDWPQKLSAVCQEWQALAFDWDGRDCVTFAGDCILAVTGEDPIEDIRGRYKSKIGAARVIKNEGFDSLGDMIASRLDEARLDQLRRGDVALFEGLEGDFVGVVMGAHALSPTGSGGLVQTSLKLAKRGFKANG